MPTVPGLRYLPLKPTRWPQDDLRVPDGFGAMSRISNLNRKLIGREYYQLTTSFLSMDRVVGQSLTVCAQTPNYGDFVCSTIAVGAFTTAGAQYTPYGKLQIRDVRSGYNFFDTFVRLHHFVPADPTAFGVNNGVNPAIRSDIPQPYYFTRDGAVEITVTLDPLVTSVSDIDVFVLLGGWLEYQHVSK